MMNVAFAQRSLIPSIISILGRGISFPEGVPLELKITDLIAALIEIEDAHYLQVIKPRCARVCRVKHVLERSAL